MLGGLRFRGGLCFRGVLGFRSLDTQNTAAKNQQQPPKGSEPKQNVWRLIPNAGNASDLLFGLCFKCHK